MLFPTLPHYPRRQVLSMACAAVLTAIRMQCVHTPRYLSWWWWCGLILAVPEWPVRCLLTAARFYKLYEQREVRPLFQRPFQGFLHLVCSLGNTRFVALIGRLEMKQFVHLEPHFRHDFASWTLVYNKRATTKCEGRNSNTTCTV